tara:strand:+ start:145 stop:774 length:630 start_codon:yes stop_codon:yes gene_type:complete
MFIFGLNNASDNLYNTDSYLNNTTSYSNNSNRIFTNRNNNINNSNDDEEEGSSGFPYSMLALIIPIGLIILLFCYIHIQQMIWNCKNNIEPDTSSSIHTSMSVSTREIDFEEPIKPTILFIKDVSQSIVEKEEGDSENLDVCVICIEKYKDGDKILSLNCNHSYHKECISPWIKKQIENNIKPKCPTCRTPIDYEWKIEVNESDSGVIV